MKGKVTMDAIEDVTRRNTSYKKRKATLIRKMEEITTLCGVKGSLIMFSELEKGGLVTWPANPEAVQEMLEDVKWGFGSRVHDMSSLTEEMVAKERLVQARLESSIEEIEARLLMSEWFLGRMSVKDLSVKEMQSLICVIDEKERSVQARMRDLMKPGNLAGLDDETQVPDMYLNLESPDYTNHGMNLMGVDMDAAGTMPMWNGGQDLAGPNSWDYFGTRNG